MEPLFVKTSEDIKSQIEFWYLKCNRLKYEEVDGKDIFTLFDKMPSYKREDILSQLSLNTGELPVLVLTIGADEYIVNTTDRFIRFKNNFIGYLWYKDFECHKGFKSVGVKDPVSGKTLMIKTDGYFSEFGLVYKSGVIVYWTIPTGSAGFAFWNVTNKCELIGRKYVIEDKA